jgi:hypothetical protein
MKISKKVIDKIVFSLVMLCMLTPLTVFAQDDLMMMIVPAVSGGNRPLKNVITVAKANGKFTDPVAAVNSITDASATNPYLVVIGPGVYTISQTLVMKPYVDIAGCGENVTKITGEISGATASSSAIISGSNYSTLSSLTVENTGGGSSSIALYNHAASPRMSNVTVTGSGGTYGNAGVYNAYYSNPKMTGVTAMAYGGTGTLNDAVFNIDSSPEMTDVTALATGGERSIGVLSSGSSPVMTAVTARASGSDSYGIYNVGQSSPVIRRSTMKGGTDGLITSTNSTATVSQSTIINGAGVGLTGTNKCVACDNGSGVALNASCN